MAGDVGGSGVPLLCVDKKETELDHGWLSMDTSNSEDKRVVDSPTHRRTLSWNCRRSGKISPTRGQGSNRDPGPQHSENLEPHQKVCRGLTHSVGSKGYCKNEAKKNSTKHDHQPAAKSGSSWWNWKLRGSRSRETSPTRDNRGSDACDASSSSTLNVKKLLDAPEMKTCYLSTDSLPSKERRSFFKEFKSHSKESKSPYKEKRSSYEKSRSRSKELRNFFKEYRSASKEEDIIISVADQHYLSTSPLPKDSSARSSPKERPSSPSFCFVRPASPCSLLSSFGSSFKSLKKSPSSTCTSLVSSPVAASLRVDSAILWSSAHAFHPPSLVVDMDVGVLLCCLIAFIFNSIKKIPCNICCK